MAETSLPGHLARALNVRAIGVYDPADPPDRPFFTWLARKHQYRRVGFPPALMDHPSVDLDGYETFVALEFPVPSGEALVAAADGGPRWARECLLAGSAFVSPLLVHRPALEALDPFAVWRLRSDEDLPADQVLRHLRIAGYGMLDGFERWAPSGYDAVLAGDVPAERAARAEWAEADGRDRFWRLLEDGSGDAWVGGYADVLPAFEGTSPEPLSETPDLAVAFGLVGAIAADPPYG